MSDDRDATKPEPPATPDSTINDALLTQQGGGGGDPGVVELMGVVVSRGVASTRSRVQLTPDHTSTDSTTTASAWEAVSSPSPSSSDQPVSQCQSPTNSLSAATTQSSSSSSGSGGSCQSTAAQLGANEFQTLAEQEETNPSDIQVGYWGF